MIKGICKFCGQEKELINSHIIPKSLCRINEIGPMVAIDSKRNTFEHNPIHQNGKKEYLMCKDCDNLLGILDNYGNKVFREIIPEHKWDLVDGYLLCKLLPNEVDYWTLKKFFISVIWRASVDSSGINLGKYEDIALKMLKGELPDNPNFFVPLIYKMNTNTPLDLSTGIFGNKTLGKRIYEIQFPHYKIMILPSIEHSQNQKEIEQFKLFYNPKFIIVQTFFLPSPSDNHLIDVVKKCQNNELRRNNKIIT